MRADKTISVLVCNAGSSTLKCSLFALPMLRGGPHPQPAHGEIEREWGEGERASIIGEMIQELERKGDSPIGVVGHRVVHGGKLRSSVRLNGEVRAELERAAAFAPLHNPLALEVIDVVSGALPGTIPQVAVFDTAFHAGMPLEAATYPVPYEWYGEGIRRYGFHGINHRYMFHAACRLLDLDIGNVRAVTCHLGNGCSLAAVHGGRSIDTTMGFTPLEGLMMGTRCGSIDPGIVFHLLRTKGVSAGDLENDLLRRSGLLGISGVSHDMREVAKAAAQGSHRAQLALSMFAHSIKKGIGAMAAALGGCDVLVFSGGIGEHHATLRARIGVAMGYLGLQIDEEKNHRASGDREISHSGSRIRAVVIHAEEDWEIARECAQLLEQS